MNPCDSVFPNCLIFRLCLHLIHRHKKSNPYCPYFLPFPQGGLMQQGLQSRRRDHNHNQSLRLRAMAAESFCAARCAHRLTSCAPPRLSAPICQAVAVSLVLKKMPSLGASISFGRNVRRSRLSCPTSHAYHPKNPCAGLFARRCRGCHRYSCIQQPTASLRPTYADRLQKPYLRLLQ